MLERQSDLFDVVEFEPQTTWVRTPHGPNPYRASDAVLEHIAQLPGRKLVHSIGVPVGGTVKPSQAQLELLRRTVTRLGAPWISEHLSFNATHEFSAGFFLPPRQTPQGIRTIDISIRDLKEAVPVPVAVETGVNYLKRRQDEIADGAFVGAVVERADCGILLDLHNVFTNALNGRQSVEDFVAQIQLERVWEIHIAGGFELEGFWLDAHSGAIPEPLLEIAKRVIPSLTNLKAIIFEIFPSFVPLVGLETIRSQIEKLHELWELRRQPRLAPATVPSQTVVNLVSDDPITPAVWEQVLGALVIGRAPTNKHARELAADPGVSLVNHLVGEFRASMIVSVLRLTSRLMMLALGPNIFRTVLEDFWSKVPPQLFASSEAEAFADYLVSADIKVPQLMKVLEFERAVLSTLTDDKSRVVCFDFDPLPLLRGLAEGRLNDAYGDPGQFEIEVTPDSLEDLQSLSLESLQQSVPYH